MESDHLKYAPKMKSRRKQIPSSGSGFVPNRWTKLNVDTDNYYTTSTGVGNVTYVNRNWNQVSNATWNPEYMSGIDVDLTEMTVKKRFRSELTRFLCADLFEVRSICESHLLLFCSLYIEWVGSEAARILEQRYTGSVGCCQMLTAKVLKPSQEDIDFGLMIVKPNPEWKAILMAAWDDRGFIPRHRPGIMEIETNVVERIRYHKEILIETLTISKARKFECCVCFGEKPIGHFVKLKPCEHRLTCHTCVRKMSSCPICRQKIRIIDRLSIKELLTLTEL